jgi:peroxiredoxin (alkyl hydroperoxide reductase subunit C)
MAAYVHDLDVGRSVDEILRLLAAYQSGEKTGCDWHPGQATLGKPI